jgi:hypothetical protein
MKEFFEKLALLLAQNRLFLRPWKILESMVLCGLERQRGVVLFYDEAGKSGILDLIREIKSQTTMLLVEDEAYQLFRP